MTTSVKPHMVNLIGLRSLSLRWCLFRQQYSSLVDALGSQNVLKNGVAHWLKRFRDWKRSWTNSVQKSWLRAASNSGVLKVKYYKADALPSELASPGQHITFFSLPILLSSLPPYGGDLTLSGSLHVLALGNSCAGS